MKTAILAGGLGTRLAGETELRPKPMIEIGGKPILWHIMKHFAAQGHDEFVLALGYKGEAIKRYFRDYHELSGNMTLRLGSGPIERGDSDCEDWTVHLVDTGQETQTGGRIKRLQPWLKNEPFFATYGDGVADIDLGALLKLHRSEGRIATVTAVRPPARFGGVVFDGNRVAEFTEKPQIGEGWISGGFLVLEPAIFDFISGDETILEAHVLERLAREGQLSAYRHEGFWQCMDTPRDLRLLENLWKADRPPWKTWER